MRLAWKGTIIFRGLLEEYLSCIRNSLENYNSYRAEIIESKFATAVWDYLEWMKEIEEETPGETGLYRKSQETISRLAEIAIEESRNVNNGYGRTSKLLKDTYEGNIDVSEVYDVFSHYFVFFHTDYGKYGFPLGFL